jgi:hypothetical protein
LGEIGIYNWSHHSLSVQRVEQASKYFRDRKIEQAIELFFGFERVEQAFRPAVNCF